MTTKKNALFLATGLIFLNSTWAADGNDGTDGSLGDTSTGSLSVTMGVPLYNEPGDPNDPNNNGGSLLIRNLDNLNLGVFGPNVPLADFSDFCIYGSGVGDGLFSVSVAMGGGDDGTGSFILKGTADSTKTLPYLVKYSTTQLGADINSAGTGAPGSNSFENLKGVGLSGGNCTTGGLNESGDNASIYVYVANDAAANATADTYTGKLTLTVSAN